MPLSERSSLEKKDVHIPRPMPQGASAGDLLLFGGGVGLDGCSGVGGMVGGHDVHQLLPDAGAFVGIGDLHESLQLHQEKVVIEGDGIADVDKVVIRFAKAFLGHELLLIQLFSGAQAGVHDLDILPRLESGQLDQVPGQGVDLDGPPHIQHENLAAVGVGAG